MTEWSTSYTFSEDDDDAYTVQVDETSSDLWTDQVVKRVSELVMNVG